MEKTVIWRDNALFASKAKINIFEIFSSGWGPKGTWSEERISKNDDFILLVQKKVNKILYFST